MLSSLTIKKNSHLFEPYQKQIIVDLLKNYFARHISDHNGVYLNVLNLDNINFYWSNSFTLENSIFGSWNPLYFNSIFLKPPITDSIYRNYLKDKYKIDDNNSNYSDDIQSYNNYIYDIQKYNDDFITVTPNNNIRFMDSDIENKYWIADYEKYCFLKHMLEIDTENEGIIRVVCHELYHKWQFSANPITPILYIANFFISLFFGYALSSKLKWTIEGDVRISVDNEHLENVVRKFSKCFQMLKHYALIKKLEIVLNTPKYRQLILNKEDGEKIIDIYQERIHMFYNPSFKDDNKYNEFTEDHQTRKTYEFKILFEILKEYQVLTPEFISFVEQN